MAQSSLVPRLRWEGPGDEARANHATNPGCPKINQQQTLNVLYFLKARYYTTLLDG